MSSRDRRVFVYNQTKETFLALQVKVADSIWGRMVGLLGRKSLQPSSGVWLVPATCIHTIGMLFSFDMVLIDRDFSSGSRPPGDGSAFLHHTSQLPRRKRHRTPGACDL